MISFPVILTRLRRIESKNSFDQQSLFPKKKRKTKGIDIALENNDESVIYVQEDGTLEKRKKKKQLNGRFLYKDTARESMKISCGIEKYSKLKTFLWLVEEKTKQDSKRNRFVF